MLHLLHLRKSAPSVGKPSLLDNPRRSRHNRRLRAQHRDSQPPGIQRDTPLLPDIIAETICNQVANYLGLDPSSPLPTSLSSFSPVKKKFPPRLSNLKSQISNLKSPSLYDYIPKLVAKAEHCYTRHRQFRKLLRARGNDGRSALYMFMRHWLYAHLATNHPRLAQHLPQTFALGHQLPTSRETNTETP